MFCHIVISALRAYPNKTDEATNDECENQVQLSHVIAVLPALADEQAAEAIVPALRRRRIQR
jgi:hypothetical protein